MIQSLFFAKFLVDGQRNVVYNGFKEVLMYKIFEIDPYLLPFENDVNLRMQRYYEKRRELIDQAGCLSDFANGHEYYGFHKTADGWVYREWAPGADEMYVMGDMNGWNSRSCPMTRLDGGVFEIKFSKDNQPFDGCYVKAIVVKNGVDLIRIPSYARRVVQNEHGGWCAQVTEYHPYPWRARPFKMPETPFVYECHVGMAQEDGRVGTYREFADKILPRIKAQGYNVIQVMAIMEHPYYGSFGYQVSSFFAPCSRFGTADDLKYLVDKAHGMKIAVLLDLIHSHAIKNEYEGLNNFDGTPYQYFHEGARGHHPAWDTKLFNYGKNEVLHFLLSNLKYWLTEFNFDGFRFDGVTSMLYMDHGLGVGFTDYGKYFSMNTDLESITYLQLANELIREVKPWALTIAEDMSAMPGMCLPIEYGGIGFDYRLAMGVPDFWIKQIKNVPDEGWNMWSLWHELTSRRPGEKYVGYAESHDQALVGDKTLIFRLMDSEMYTGMSKFFSANNLTIERGLALIKLIRLSTMTLSGEAYLNFMGNEFGHPEWIDFPREGNGWSYHYCRRQWHLVEDTTLHYHEINDFDKALVALLRKKKTLAKGAAKCLFIDDMKKVIVYERGGLIFAINFHPTNSYTDYHVSVPRAGKYRVLLTTDSPVYSGQGRVCEDYVYTADKHNGKTFQIYLPARTAVVLGAVRK